MRGARGVKLSGCPSGGAAADMIIDLRVRALSGNRNGSHVPCVAWLGVTPVSSARQRTEGICHCRGQEGEGGGGGGV